MKIFLSGLRRVWLHTCVAFTVLVLLLFLVGSTVPAFGNAIEVGSILTVFLFSFLLGCANLLLLLRRIPTVARVLLHYAACGITFYVVFVLIAAKANGPLSVLIYGIAYTVLYALIVGLYCLFRSIGNKAKKGEEDNYTGLYS